MMKRALASALVVSAITGFGLAGCGEESKVTDKSTVSTPDGSTTVTKETKVKTTGDNPPGSPNTPPGATPK